MFDAFKMMISLFLAGIIVVENMEAFVIDDFIVCSEYYSDRSP